MRLPIKALADIQIGYQFRKGVSPNHAGSHLLIQVKDIDANEDHRLAVNGLDRVTPDREASRYEVNEGDVLFLSKGRRNFATLVEGLAADGVRKPTIVAGYFFILRLSRSDVDPRYLVWAINQPPAQGYLQSHARGSAMPFVPRDNFVDLEIDIPDLATQRTIVELNELGRREQALIHDLAAKRAQLISGLSLVAAQKNHH